MSYNENKELHKQSGITVIFVGYLLLKGISNKNLITHRIHQFQDFRDGVKLHKLPLPTSWHIEY